MFTIRKCRTLLSRVVLVGGVLLTVVPDMALYAQQSTQDTGKLYLPVVAGGTGASSDELAQVAVQQVAEQQGVKEALLAVENSATSTYPLQAVSAYGFKVINSQTGDIHVVTLNAQGQTLDTTQLDTAEQNAQAAEFGRVDPVLAALLRTEAVNGPLSVVIWLKEPAYTGIERPAPQVPTSVIEGPAGSEPVDVPTAPIEATPNDAAVVQDAAAELTAEELQLQQAQEAFYAQADAARAAFVEQVTAATVSRLSALGYAATADRYAPALYTALPAAAIQEVARWPEVDTVYLDQINQPELEIVRPTIFADVVHGRGITGSGVRVAQIEVGGRVATANPNLSGVVQDGSYICSTASGHSTGVAGIIRSRHATRRGIAPNVTLWAGGSCTGNTSQLQNRSTAAVSWGARALNLSWGSNIGLVPGASDRFYDSIVINQFRTIVKSAGNEGAGCGGNGNVTSPGLAYNIITVGNFDDKNTASWSGDSMSSCSSWRDPISTWNDREKPEMAAPGTNINSTTTASPWTGAIGSGTSYAAPAVTGAAALLIQRNATLGSWPEAIKSILMTTALHNIEGSARLSEVDGAGAIALDRADNITRGVNGSWGARSYTCSTAATLDVATIALVRGTRTRASIVWDNDPAYSLYASRPSADLDLQIVNPSGTVVASSISFDNTYELVDFTPSVSGNYKIRVRKLRCDFSPRYLAWSWHRGN